MTIMTRCLIACVAAALLLPLTGCNSVDISTRQELGGPTYAPTDPATVQILRTAPTAPHVRLGELTVEPHGSPTVQEIESKMQAAGAKIGANAVVIVADKTEIMGAYVTGPWWGRSLQTETGRVIIGVAIRYTKP